MGLSSSPKSTSTSYSGSSNPAFSPYAINAVNQVESQYGKAQPGLDALVGLSNNTVVPGLANQFGQSQAAAGQARGYNSDVVSGKYMQGNPYISDILGQLNEQIGNSVGGHFSVNGRYGSGANQAVMGKQIANADANVLYANYGDEMARRDQAANALQTGNLGDTASLLQALQQGSTMPYAGSESLANSLGALFSGGQDKSKQTGASPIWGAIGAGLGAAGAALSDRRLKTNIVKVGEYPDGLGIYEWNWKSAPNGTKVKGVIADEVKALRPAAYIENYRNGFAGVNYAAL